MRSPRLILASGSPRRRRMLRRLGLEFEVCPADVDESPHPGEAAADYVTRLADAKAAAVLAARTPAADVILAADTVVVIDGELLGKPRDRGDAEGMLARLSGRGHEVLTGVAVQTGLDGGPRLAALERTRVTFAEMTPEEIAWYAATGEPLDKAGAYAIQGFGALFVDRVDGNYSNVVGLPLPAVYRLLRRAGLDLPATFNRRT